MRLLHHLAAVAVAVAAAGMFTPGLGTPAQAATCAGSGGVSVVVDFKSLGGGAQSQCDADGGGQKASALFTDNGYELTYAQRTPGFVCRVQDVPADDPCVNTSPANAYWGLWWSDGKTGKWTYATLGVGSLTIPAGGSVALAWDDVDGQAKPGAAPPKRAAASPSATHPASASPTVKPTPTPASKPTPTPSPTPASTPTESPTPTATATATESATPTPTPTVPAPTPSATETATDDIEPTSAPVDTDGGGLPAWVPIVVILVLFAGAAGVVVVRRRRA